MTKRTLAVLLHTFVLLGITSAPARAELSIAAANPDKIYYKPGEPMKITVEVTNPDPTPATARLKVQLVHDIDSAWLLGDVPVTLAAKTTKTFTFASKAQPWLGIETRATLSRGAQQLSAQSDYCTCARTVGQVLMASPGNTLMSGHILDESRDAIIASTTKIYRQFYGNYWEWFAWAPSDYDDMTPDGDRWWGGQAQYNQSKPVMLALNKALAAQGVQVFSYGRAAGAGPLTMEFFRKHPDYALYWDGRPSLEMYDVARLDYLTALGPPHAGDGRPLPGTPVDMEKAGYAGAAWFAPYVSASPTASILFFDANHDGVIRHNADEMGRAALQLGFQGVRFDGEFMTYRHQQMDGTWNGPPAFDTDARDTRLVRNMKAWTWARKPGYMFAYNTAMNFRWNIKANNTPIAFREKCKDGGVIAREELAFPGNVAWEDYIKVVRHDSDITRYYGGHSALYPFQRNVNYLYSYIIAYALRSHQMMGHVGQPDILKPAVARFATRWAAQLWDDSVHAWAGAKSEITVSSDRKLWWDQFAATRSLNGGKSTQFLVHLVNAPESKTTLGDKPVSPEVKAPDDVMPAAPARNTEVRWTRPRGFKRAFVADLDRGDLQPVTARREGAALVFTIPEIGHWSILMIEADTPTPAPVWELTKEDAKLKLPTPQELSLAPAEALSNKWKVVLQAEDYYPGAYGVADRVGDAAARGASAMRAVPGRPTTYFATGVYVFPRIAGHYLAKFRLKVKDNTVDKPVIEICIQEAVTTPLPGVPHLTTPIRVLKGTDFKAPGVYQEFEVPFGHADVGFHVVVPLYKGNGEVTWDQTALELIKPWTLAELEKHYASLASPADLQKVQDEKTDVLLMRGLWNRTYRIDEAVARLPGAVAPSSTYTFYSQYEDTRFKGFDFDWKPLYGQDVIVLANVETRGFAYGKVKMLKQWVQDGGGLVILGGLVTLGQNGNMERGWPDFLPVSLKMPFEVQKCVPPIAFAAPAAELGIDIQKWQSPPQVMFRHMVKAKPGAKVLLAGSGGEPLLVGGQYGKGRVVVFTGTVLGEAPPGKTAFWQSPAWPGLVAAAMAWSAASPTK